MKRSIKQIKRDIIVSWMEKLAARPEGYKVSNNSLGIMQAINALNTKQSTAVLSLIAAAYSVGSGETREHIFKLKEDKEKEDKERDERKQACKLYSIAGGRSIAL